MTTQSHKAVLLIIFLAACITPAFADDARDAAEELKDKGNELYRDGKVDEAIEMYRSAIEADSTYAFAYNNLGIALYDKGDWRQSAEMLEKAVALDDTYAKAYNSLGNAYFAAAEYEKAKNAYSQSIELVPGFAQKHINLGNAYYALGMAEEAVKEYEEALEIDAYSPDAANNKGVALQSLGDIEGARESYLEAINISSRDVRANINLGILHFEADPPNYKRAIEYFTRATEYDEDNLLAQYNFGLVLSTIGETADALVKLRAAAKLAPENPDVQYALGVAFIRHDAYSLAIPTLKKVLVLQPEYPRAAEALAYAEEMWKK